MYTNEPHVTHEKYEKWNNGKKFKKKLLYTFIVYTNKSHVTHEKYEKRNNGKKFIATEWTTKLHSNVWVKPGDKQKQKSCTRMCE